MLGDMSNSIKKLVKSRFKVMKNERTWRGSNAIFIVTLTILTLAIPLVQGDNVTLTSTTTATKSEPLQPIVNNANGTLYNKAMSTEGESKPDKLTLTTGSTSTKSRPACKIRPADRLLVKYLTDSLVYVFEVSIYNESTDPLRTDVSETYKPWKWYRTSSEHGKTLLTLSFNYDVLSLNILTIGVEKVVIKLKDSPYGCFKDLTASERVEMLRAKVFDNFKRPSRNVEGKEVGNDDDKSSVMFVCNEIVRQTYEGFGEFANRCCRRDENGDIVCSEKEDNVYITVLYVCIGLVKLTMFMFCPLLIPAEMYTAAYLASEYVVNQTHELKMKIFVSESTTTSVRYKSRLTLEQTSDWRRLRESLEDVPMDEICHVKVPELRIKVQGKRIIPANEPPTGLLRSLYDNLVRCKIRGMEPFKDCCDMSVYGTLEPLIKHKCTWDQVVIQFMKFVSLLITPLPFYIRIFVYYRFEEHELHTRNWLMGKLGMEQTFNPFRMNVIQYLSPTHPLFYTTYAFYIISGIVIGFSGKWIREKLKSVTRSAFHDMQNVSRTNVLQIVMGILIWPFKKLGLLALVACPAFTIVTLPFWCVIFLLYGVPTFYLGYRLVFHSIKQLGGDISISMFESDKPMSNMKQRAYKVKKSIAKIDKGVHINRAILTEEDRHSPCLNGFGRMFAIRRLGLQVLLSLFCLVVLLSSVLMFVEAIGIIVEVLVFTMMGIIVNAGSTLRYVSMALLVIVYMHNCYDSVYANYLEFNGTVLNDIMDRVEDLKKVASLPSSMQENAAFQVKCVEAVDEIPTSLNLEKKTPQWRIGHLLLFLDSFDTPRIPLNLFKKLCEVRIHGAPGPVYINLLKATAKFSVIVVFLFFVMIVVMAFGSNQQMSSTNQTLATLAGGFVPMLLKNVLSSKSAKLNLKTLSFKGQVDEIIAEYKQNFPINDFVVKVYDPVAEAEAEKEKEKEANEKDGKDGKDSNDAKDKGAEKEDSDDKVTSNGVSDTVVEKQTNEDSEKEKKDIVKTNGGTSLGATTNSLQIPGLFRDSIEDLAIQSLSKSQRWLSRLSLVPTEDNFVDLFIDLSAQPEKSHWQWYDDSNDSMQSITMLNQQEMHDRDPRMPYYQPATVVQFEDETLGDNYPRTSPPDYNTAVMKRE